jgi:mono/diheme cytochrome c family protein
MTRGELLGSGFEELHHLFVWPAFALSVGLVIWRLLRGGRMSPGSLRLYVAAMSLTSGLMMGAGFWGGELLLHPGAKSEQSRASVIAVADANSVNRGRDLFLMNCAHCHGDDAHGTEEAPDLTAFRKSDSRIASVVKKGIKGEMPRFDQKLTDENVRLLTLFLHSVNGRAK